MPTNEQKEYSKFGFRRKIVEGIFATKDPMIFLDGLIDYMEAYAKQEVEAERERIIERLREIQEVNKGIELHIDKILNMLPNSELKNGRDNGR